MSSLKHGSVVLGLVLYFTAAPVSAQQRADLRVVEDTTVVQQIDLRDGSKFVGRIVSAAGDQIVVRTVSGIEVMLERTDVTAVQAIRGDVVRGEYWADDPSSSRLFFGPTARVPGHGHGYFGVYELVVPSVAVGIGDRFMISGGASMIPGIRLDEQAFFIAPKVQLIRTKPVKVAAGVMWVQPMSEPGVGLLFSNATAGSAEGAVTVGVGIPFTLAEDLIVEADPMILIGGELRVTRYLKVMSENWLLTGVNNGYGVFGAGVRILVNRVTVEAALFTNDELEAVLPLVSFSVAW